MAHENDDGGLREARHRLDRSLQLKQQCEWRVGESKKQLAESVDELRRAIIEASDESERESLIAASAKQIVAVARERAERFGEQADEYLAECLGHLDDAERAMEGSR